MAELQDRATLPVSAEAKRELFATWQFKIFEPPAGFADWPVDQCVAYIDSIDGWEAGDDLRE